MKKILVIVLSLILVCSMFACNKENKPADSADTKAAPVSTDSKDTKQSDDSKEPAQSADDTDAPIIVTEPIETERVIPDVPDSGFCVIGAVDEANSKVAVGLWSGKAKTFKYEGTAPAVGQFAYYETDGENIALDIVELEDYFGWRLYDDPTSGEFLYGNDGVSDYYVHFSDDCAAFLKFSDTNYSIYNNGNMFDVSPFDYQWPNTVWPCGLKCLDYDGDETIDVVLADATHTYDDYAQYGGDQFINITTLFNGNTEIMEKGTVDIVIE